MSKTDQHSRLVRHLKVVLPLAALALLSSMFLFSNKINVEGSLDYTDLDLRDLTENPRMNLPQYSGLTADGTSIRLDAQAARPTGFGTETGRPDAQEVTVDLAMPDGGTADIRADHAQLDNTAQEIFLEGNVVMTGSAGYRITVPEMTAALDYSGARSDGPTFASAPGTTIHAQGFVLSHEGTARNADAPRDRPTRPEPAKDAEPYLLIFSGGVKLVYEPPSE